MSKTSKTKEKAKQLPLKQKTSKKIKNATSKKQLSIKKVTKTKNGIGNQTAEEKLLISEARFKGVISSMQDLVYTLDLNQNITGLYGMWAEMYGLTEELLLGKKLTQFLSPAESEINNVANSKALEGKPVKFEWSLYSNNDRFYFESSLTPFYGSSNEVIGIVGVARDITERKKNEMIIRESEDKYRRLFEQSPDPIIIHKSEIINFVNSATIELLGAKNSDEIIGKSIYDFIHPVYHKSIRNRLSTLKKASDKLPVAQLKFVRIDGSIIDVEVSTILFMHEGELAAYVVARDITERKKAEKQIQFQAELINVIRDGITLIDRWGNIVYVNDATVQIHGYTYKEILSMKISNLEDENNKDSCESIIDEVYEKGLGSFERLHRRKDGSTFLVEVSSQLITLEDQKYVLNVDRDLSERAIAERQINLQARLLDSAKDLIFLHEKDGSIVYTNEEACKSLGFERNEILQKNMFDFIYEDDKDKIIERVNKIVEYGSANFETQNIRKDGSVFPVEVFAQLVKINEKDFFLAVCRDITERKKAELEIRESNERYKSLIEHSPDAIIVHSGNEILYANPAAAKLVGAESARGKYIGTSIFRFIHPDSLPVVKNRAYEALSKNILLPNTIEKIVRLDGTIIYAEVVTVPINYGGTKALQIILRDITEKRRIEIELKKLSRAVEQSPATIIITDINGDIEYVNPKFSETSEYSFDEVRGKNLRLLKSGTQPPEYYKNLWDTILSGNEWRGEFHNMKKSGELYWENATISPIKNDKGETTHFLAIKEDITEKKRIEAELIESKEIAEEANKLKSSLLANMSHEFRTPLNGILGFAQLLRDEVSDADQVDMLDKITRSGKRLMSTLNSILTLTELENNDYLITKSEVDLGFFCQQMKTLYEAATRAKKLNFNISTGDEEIIVMTDENLLAKILSSLIENAIKYTAYGEIGLSVERKFSANGSCNILIHVSDTGIGINRDDQKIIFREFKQLSEGFRRDFEGLGLGLALARKIATLIGGTITIESEIGKGSTFTFSLPYQIPVEPEVVLDKHIPAAEEAHFTNRRNQTMDRPKVLLVEDNLLNIEVVQKFLAKTCEVFSTTDGATAIEMGTTNDYDIFMIDINLGQGINGVEVLNGLKKLSKYKDIPVIALTGYASDSNKRDFLAQGFTHYLAKPFEKKELINVIQEILGKK